MFDLDGFFDSRNYSLPITRFILLLNVSSIVYQKHSESIETQYELERQIDIDKPRKHRFPHSTVPLA